MVSYFGNRMELNNLIELYFFLIFNGSFFNTFCKSWEFLVIKFENVVKIILLISYFKWFSISTINP